MIPLLCNGYGIWLVLILVNNNIICIFVVNF